MNAISVSGISKAVKDGDLFSDLSFGLEEGEKVGIIGRNGSGKSTLLKVIDGTLVPDSGKICVNNALSVGRLDQNVTFPSGCTLAGYLRLAPDERIELLNRYERGETRLSQILEEKEVWRIEERYRRFLSELGVDFSVDQSMDTISGGTRKKAAIARLLALDNKILLLDEPTNHLDIPAIEWLENYLAAKDCTVILVTHDRYFLDRICSRIIEIDKGKVYFYDGGYTDFLQQREERINALQKEQDRLATILRRELEWLKHGPKARTGKDSGRKKRIEEMQSQRTKAEEESRAFSSLQRRMGKKILELENVSLTRGELRILDNFNLEFIKGQRIGVIGPNGSGKTTLLDVITSNLPVDSGTVDTGVNTVFGYYDQNSAHLPADKTPLEFFSDISEHIALAPGYTVSAAKFLELFGFPSSFHRIPIDTLSGGEKRRLYLLSRLLANPNFLVLDEPTNDLDMDTLSRLEQYILDFAGCVVCVSHDRAFLDRICDELIVMPGATRFEGCYSEWHSAEKEAQKSVRTESVKVTASENRRLTPAKKGLSFKEQREFEATEARIEETETEIASIEADFSSGKPDLNGSLTQHYNALKSELEGLYSRWEELSLKM